MSILKNVLSRFSRRKPAEPAPSPDVTPAAGTASQASDPASPAEAPAPPDNVIYIYSHGFTNGVYRIDPDKDSFERFLEFCNQSDRIRELKLLKEKAVAEAEVKLAAATAAYVVDRDTVVEKGRLAEHVGASISEIEQRRLQRTKKEEALVVQVKETVAEYAWVPALFYLVAGVVFIVADISITKQITSWGFGMSGWQSWVFALGLAFTAFLIKPTIDRLFEKPFQAGGFKLKTLYKCVLLFITLVGLCMLFLLGKFRSDSEIASNKLQVIHAEMSTADPNSQRFIELQAEDNVIQNSLDENFSGKYGLILSGMLFAIGGAICLAISFGSLKHLINRYWILPFRIRRVQKRIKGLDPQMSSLREQLNLVRTEQEKAEKRLADNEIVLMKEELKSLQNEQADLLAEFYQAQYDRERALYLDGRNKGEKYQVDGELLYKVPGSGHSSLYLGKKEDKEDAESPRAYTRRPFVKMRKMIADNFNKNQNHQSYDGTEFEIVS